MMKKEEITIDGFYDNVEIVSAEDRAEMNKLKDNQKNSKINWFKGEKAKQVILP